MAKQSLLGKLPCGRSSRLQPPDGGDQVRYAQRPPRYCHFNLALEFASDGTVSTVISIARNVTDLHEARQSLKESEARYRAIVEDTPMLVCSFLPGGEITFVNRSYCEFFGMTQEQLVGTRFLTLVPEAVRETVVRTSSTVTAESPTVSYEHQVVAPGGQVRWQQRTDRALFNDQGEVVCYHATGQDITERKHAEEHLRYLSLHDRLTGVHNRAYFEEELTRLSGGRDHPVTIICVEIDDLKTVNDALGHDRGDEVLKGAAEVLPIGAQLGRVR